jgi:hypothetical protein
MAKKALLTQSSQALLKIVAAQIDHQEAYIADRKFLL